MPATSYDKRHRAGQAFPVIMALKHDNGTLTGGRPSAKISWVRVTVEQASGGTKKKQMEAST